MNNIGMKRIGHRRVIEEFEFKETRYARTEYDKNDFAWYEMYYSWKYGYIEKEIHICKEDELEHLYQKLKREAKLKRILNEKI